MKNTFLIFLFISIVAASCGNSTKDQSRSAKETAVPEATKTVQNTAEEYSPILSSYFALKDALVETDAVLAREKSVKLVSALEESGIHGEIIKHADAVAGSEDIEFQRAEFEKISKEIYTMAKKTKLGEGVIYKQFCPMAFGNKGAYWLSSNEEIMNPYFGDKMLHCGKIEETVVVD